MGEIEHNKKHGVDSTTDHDGMDGAVEDNLISTDANGLPKDAGVASSNVKKHNYVGYIPPESTARTPMQSDDSSKGYSQDSRWYNPDLEMLWICQDATVDDAKWALIDADARIVNKTGAEIPVLRVVRSLEDLGGHTKVALANALTDAGYKGVSGVTFESVADNAFSFQMHSGTIVRNVPVPTATWNGGDTGFLSDADGIITPAQGTHRIEVCTILKAHNTQGIIFIDILKSGDTHYLDDVDNTPASVTKQIRQFNAVTGLFELTVSPIFDNMTFTDNQGDAFTVRDLATHQLDAFNELATTRFNITEGTSAGARTITLTQPDTEKLEFIINEKRLEQPTQVNMTKTHTGLEGTDASPNAVYTFIKNSGTDEPELDASNSDPNGVTPHVDGVYEMLGSVSGSTSNVFATNNIKASIYEKLEKMLDRFKEQGTLYKSGMDITADADSFAITSGTAKHVLSNAAIPALEVDRVTPVDSQFTIEDDSTYTTYDDFQIDKYYDGVTVANTHRVKCRVVAVINNPELTSARIHIIPQAGSTTYNTDAQAWRDSAGMARTTPRNNIVKYSSVHIADIVIKNTTGTFTLVANPDTGLYYDDVRGKAGTEGGGGGAASQNLYETFTGDSGTSTASSSTASMAVEGADGIITAVEADKITISTTGLNKGKILFLIDGAGSAIAVGAYNAQPEAHYSGTIISHRIRSMDGGVEVNGSVSFDMYKNGTKISGSEPIVLSSQSDVITTDLSGWSDLNFVTDDVFELRATGTPDVKYAIVDIRCDKTGA